MHFMVSTFLMCTLVEFRVLPEIFLDACLAWNRALSSEWVTFAAEFVGRAFLLCFFARGINQNYWTLFQQNHKITVVST